MSQSWAEPRGLVRGAQTTRNIGKRSSEMARVRRATGARLSSSVRSGTRFGRSFAANALRLHLHALAYNLGNFMRTLAMPAAAEPWSLTSLRKKLIKIGAKVTSWLVGQVPDGRGRWVPRSEYSENVKFWSLGP